MLMRRLSLSCQVGYKSVLRVPLPHHHHLRLNGSVAHLSCIVIAIVSCPPSDIVTTTVRHQKRDRDGIEYESQEG
jgi:flavin reductase (DIM6/NTAB) family NADH-FMN oxidoreductase RutF